HQTEQPRVRILPPPVQRQHRQPDRRLLERCRQAPPARAPSVVGVANERGGRRGRLARRQPTRLGREPPSGTSHHTNASAGSAAPVPGSTRRSSVGPIVVALNTVIQR